MGNGGAPSTQLMSQLRNTSRRLKMPTLDIFRQLAGYNRWANARLYQATLALPDELYRRNVGVFFGSLHATLNHLLLTDRLWLSRLTGEGQQPGQLHQILYEKVTDLASARAEEDDRIVSLVLGYDEGALGGSHAYKTTSGKPQQQPLGDILLHFFNHQTHHRGQAHSCLSILTGAEPPPLDLLLFQRGLQAPNLADLARTQSVP
jgi:uncharacterized damage-inducible protein DinB